MIRTEVLPSGLSLVTESMTEARSVCIGFWVGTGSRDEDLDHAGASHVLEHLLFKGTDERSAASIAEAVDEVGGDFNAFTTKEYTSFYIRLLAEHLTLGLDILSDIMWRPALRTEDLDAERQVILDEILMHADEPADEAAEQSSAALFPDHPLGREVLGSVASVSAMTADGIRAFFCEHYRPGNMVAAVAGDFDHEMVAAGLEARCAGESGAGPRPTRSLARRPGGRPAGHPAGNGAGPRRVGGTVGQPRATRAATRWPSSTTCSAVGCPAGSSRRSVSGAGWPTRCGPSGSPTTTPGSLSVGLGTAPEHVGEVLDIVTAQLALLGSDGITERELAIAKGNLRAETLLACEDSARG